jgi:ABC-type transporter Mla subunit MlaD
MRVITRELQHIGHNINQVTTAIHRANKQSHPIDTLLAQFNVLLRSYLEAREKLKETIEKYVYQ